MERIPGIRYISDKEFYVVETKVTLLENNVIHIIAIGEQNKQTASLHQAYIKKLIDALSQKVNLLIDLNNSGKNSSSARKTWQEIAESPGVRKTALYGTHPVARVLASFVMGVMKKKNIGFFPNKDEAYAWLMNDLN